MKKNYSSLETYVLTNLILLLILVLMLLYPIIIDYFNLNFTCQYKLLHGNECRSCRITRGLQACLKNDFVSANKFNSQSNFIYVSIIGQICFRISVLFFFRIKRFRQKHMVNKLFFFDLLILTSLFAFNLWYFD